jgi:methionyl-tRNA synthetase
MQLNISHDRFIRTTNSTHEAVVKALLAAVWNNGDIRKAAYNGRYCVACEEYKDDDDLDESGNCLVHRSPCPERSEVCFFLFARLPCLHCLFLALVDLFFE